ncbi:hypothetical protein P3S67_029944 [Capsicum chacoense]
MSSEPKVRVSFFWDGDIIYDENTIHYNCPPKYNVKYPLNLRFKKLCDSLYKRMGLNSSDYKLIIIGKYPKSFLGQGQLNFGEWLINDDDSLGDFLRAPNDYIDQIKLTMLEVYVRKEPRSSHCRSPLLNDMFPQSSDFLQMTQYQNIHIDRYHFDLNKTINENGWCLP